jgi:hypothetical protein
MEVSMRTLRSLLAGSLIVVMALPARAVGQQHAVDPAEIAKAVARHAATEQADRAAIREALARPEVRSLAARAGVDPGRLASGLDTLTAPDLARAATAARDVNEALVGGASITISTTTIIIGLLLLLLIIVAVD